jgi:predicted RNA-binding protein with PUA-like domain
MAHWLLQGNPRRWRMDDFFQENPASALDSWSITRYLDEVAARDDIALWRAGRDAGVVALGQVTGLPYEDTAAASDYWEDIEKADRTRWWLPLRLSEAFLDAPITRQELRDDPRFGQAAILRQPQAGNPFPLTDTEWAAILDRHPSAGETSRSEPSSQWWLEPGGRIRRSELHDRYGGGRQGGISPSRKTPNLFIFTDPRSGEQHGYYDRWEADGSFHYIGHGQRGDQALAGGNRAVVNHAKDGRALRVFQGASGVVQYVGEFVLDDQHPYSWDRAASTMGGPVRRVIRFHLRRVDRPATNDQPGELGTPYRRQDEGVEISRQTAPALVDPDATGRGLRAHHRLQNQLAELVRAAGYAPRSPAPIDPDYDLAWETKQAIVVVEVKSCTKANEVRQLRLGIGQVLDYEDALLARGCAVQPVVYFERSPSDPRWWGLAERHGIQLVWPGTEPMLLQPEAALRGEGGS